MQGKKQGYNCCWTAELDNYYRSQKTFYAYEMYKVARKMAPDDDTWAIVKPLEKLVGVEVKKPSS